MESFVLAASTEKGSLKHSITSESEFFKEKSTFLLPLFSLPSSLPLHYILFLDIELSPRKSVLITNSLKPLYSHSIISQSESKDKKMLQCYRETIISHANRTHFSDNHLANWLGEKATYSGSQWRCRRYRAKNHLLPSWRLLGEWAIGPRECVAEWNLD